MRQRYPLPPSIFKLAAAPHDWLFSHIDAAVHHGGSGTTGASLRAGLPTVVKPFFGDQYFFASRVADLGVGVRLDNINASSLAAALYRALYDERMISKARKIGEKIRGEEGVATAIQAIYRELEYARSLIKPHPSSRKGDVEEEQWEMVGGEGDELGVSFRATIGDTVDEEEGDEHEI